MKTLTFEITDFLSAYHAILGRPCYAKFMAVPNYTYLKLKIPGPHRIITIGGDRQQAHLCEQENYDIATTACQPSGAESERYAMRQVTTWHEDDTIDEHQRAHNTSHSSAR
jgi:hypothetical protein